MIAEINELSVFVGTEAVMKQNETARRIVPDLGAQ